MDHTERLLAGALHQLSPAEEAELEAALRADPALDRQYQELLASLTTLLDDLDLEAVPVPAGAEERLIARLHREQRALEASDLAPPTVPEPAPVDAPSPGNPVSSSSAPRRPLWWPALPLALAAAVALVFALQPADPLQRYARTPGAVTAAIVAGGQSLGTAVRLPDGRVYVHLDTPPTDDRTYQLWHIQAGTPVSLGVFGREGVLTRVLPAGATLAVSVEPPGGSSQPTTTPLFAQQI
ncbi:MULTISPECIES: anti-sigma factor domain-containing protein [Deinococcus]|uniref:Anti-sigma factor domain-containing protein n=1 Tax=Deinococcus rufus TaxID=2136097 RepID=A0ABV7ZAZ8_9DEIO|nr:anti-sigma factor [Deinococcus sp. AB2017081]WQE94608.1 anti-sigma factor [Deinococcus sp. AB2017081]